MTTQRILYQLHLVLITTTKTTATNTGRMLSSQSQDASYHLKVLSTSSAEYMPRTSGDNDVTSSTTSSTSSSRSLSTSSYGSVLGYEVVQDNATDAMVKA